MKLVFIHGWGLRPQIWDDLSRLLSAYPQKRIDLGFFGDASLMLEDEEPIFLIGHSLGFLKGLELSKNWKGWIAVNSFPRFMDEPPRPGCVPKAALRDIQSRLKADPLKTLEGFHQFIGVPPFNFNPNIVRLLEGLESLKRLDFDTLETVHKPGLVLASENDPLIPMSTSKALAHDRKILWHKNAGHILPLSDPLWCATAIKSFLKEYENSTL